MVEQIARHDAGKLGMPELAEFADGAMDLPLVLQYDATGYGNQQLTTAAVQLPSDDSVRTSAHGSSRVASVRFVKALSETPGDLRSSCCALPSGITTCGGAELPGSEPATPGFSGNILVRACEERVSKYAGEGRHV